MSTEWIERLRRGALGPWLQALGGAFSARADRLAAALAFFALLSLVPLLVLGVAIAGVLLGEETARAKLIADLAEVTDVHLAAVVNRLLAAAAVDTSRWWKVALGLGVALWGASRIFVQVQDALNEVWGVRERATKGWREAVRERARKRGWSFAWVLVVGLLPAVSLAVQVVAAPLLGTVAGLAMSRTLSMIVTTAVGTAVVAAFLWVVYRNLPDVELGWRETLPGAVVAATVIAAGTRVMGLYLSDVAPRSVTAAVGAMLVLLLWMNFGARAMLLGAELTRASTERRRGRPRAEPHAELVPSPAR